MYKVAVISLVCLGTIQVTPAQPGYPLPQLDVWPRTKAEYQAKEDERSRWPTIPESHPDIWEAFRARMRAITEKYTGPDVVYDAALAHELVAELWVDTGHPSLNTASQDIILTTLINDVARWPEPRFPQAARERVITGLLAYIQAGGGQATSSNQARAAAVLARVGPNHPETMAIAKYLAADALDWASAVGFELGQQTALRVCADLHGGEYAWRLHEFDTEDELPVEARARGYEQARAALLALLRSDPGVQPDDLLERLRDAAQVASVRFDDNRLNDDLTCRLLIVYRSLLDRRPLIRARVADYIDRQLLTLHAQQRLRTSRHWELWGKAVSALEAERISRRFQRYLGARLDKKDLSAVERGTLERLRPLLVKK